MSKIEWTEKTWNPIVGCTVVSPGCTNCYAMKMAARIERMGGAPQYDGTTQATRGGAVWTGKMTLSEKALMEPLKRKKPTTYFVNSMGDLFHEGAPDEWIDRVFAVMALCPQHTFQVLTKRSRRMRAYVVSAERRVMEEVCDTGIGMNVAFSAIPEHDEKAVSFGVPVVRLHEWPIRNVWLGVSAEDQQRADERIPDLLATPAAKRFVSAEPLLGPIDLSDVCNGYYFQSFLTGDKWHDGPGVNSYQRGNPSLDWVIVGGESGHKARPMHPDWARSIRDQCASADVPFFFKQWGEWAPGIFTHDSQDGPILVSEADSSESEVSKYKGIVWLPTGNPTECWTSLPDECLDGREIPAARRVGKKSAGRELDGVTHDGIPT